MFSKGRVTPPDLNQLIDVADKIYNLTRECFILDLRIKAIEAEAIRKATNEPEYQIKGKSPSMEYIKSTIKHTGLSNELLGLREEFAEKEALLEREKLQFQILRDVNSIYVTELANQRKSME